MVKSPWSTPATGVSITEVGRSCQAGGLPHRCRISIRAGQRTSSCIEGSTTHLQDSDDGFMEGGRRRASGDFVRPPGRLRRHGPSAATSSLARYSTLGSGQRQFLRDRRHARGALDFPRRQIERVGQHSEAGNPLTRSKRRRPTSIRALGSRSRGTGSPRPRIQQWFPLCPAATTTRRPSASGFASVSTCRSECVRVQHAHRQRCRPLESWNVCRPAELADPVALTTFSAGRIPLTTARDRRRSHDDSSRGR